MLVGYMRISCGSDRRIGGRSPAIAGEKLDAIITALGVGICEAALCRDFGLKRTTLIETLARVFWPAA